MHVLRGGNDSDLAGDGRAPGRPTPRARTASAARATADAPPMTACAARRSSGCVDRHLALAVVAEPGRLEDRRERAPRGTRVESPPPSITGARRVRKPWSRRNCFSAMRSWHTLTERCRADRRSSPSSRSSTAAGTFSDSIVTATARVGELVERGGIVVAADDDAGRRPAPSGSSRPGRAPTSRSPARERSQDEVPAELAAADDADRRRRDDHVVPFTAAAQVEHPCGLGVAERLRGSSRPPGPRWRGSRPRAAPAFAAPDSPMANVADRDALRHLHDRQQRVLTRQRLRLSPARRAPARSSSRRACPAGAPRRRRRR